MERITDIEDLRNSGKKIWDALYDRVIYIAELEANHSFQVSELLDSIPDNGKYTYVATCVYINAKQKHPGCKKCEVNKKQHIYLYK